MSVERDQYQRDGYVLIRGAIGQRLVAECIDALGRIATGALRGPEVSVALEPAVAKEAVPAAQIEGKIRKFGNFTAVSPALLRVAMAPEIHAPLDRILGSGRVLFQEMALVKPPRIGSEKPWHQDAAYFRADDPDLIVGAWIALDQATETNGCMEFIRGSHRRGPVPHVPAADINVCTIRPDHLRWQDRVAVPMEPGDVLLFHSLVQHYTAPNHSEMRRRALQFHYHQVGLKWTTLDEHRRLFHDESGAYAGCTVAKPGNGTAPAYEYRTPVGKPVAAVL